MLSSRIVSFSIYLSLMVFDIETSTSLNATRHGNKIPVLLQKVSTNSTSEINVRDVYQKNAPRNFDKTGSTYINIII